MLVATSNYPPQGLLPDPRHHALVLPLVAALEQHCDVLELAGPVDHRAHGHGGARPGWSSGAWAYPGSAAQRAALALPVPDPGDRVRLTVGGRPCGRSPSRTAACSSTSRSCALARPRRGTCFSSPTATAP